MESWIYSGQELWVRERKEGSRLSRRKSRRDSSSIWSVGTSLIANQYQDLQEKKENISSSTPEGQPRKSRYVLEQFMNIGEERKYDRMRKFACLNGIRIIWFAFQLDALWEKAQKENQTYLSFLGNSLEREVAIRKEKYRGSSNGPLPTVRPLLSLTFFNLLLTSSPGASWFGFLRGEGDPSLGPPGGKLTEL